MDIWTLFAGLAAGFLLGRTTAGDGRNRAQRRADDLEAIERNLSGMSHQTRTKIDDLILKGRTIEAIKLCRKDLGIGLREAKLTVDHLKAGHS